MSHLENSSASRRPVRSLRTAIEMLESRTACAIDIAPAIAMIGEVGVDGGVVGRGEEGVVMICAPFSEGEAGSVGGAGSDPAFGDEMLLTMTGMPFAVSMIQERSRPARVAPLRGGLAQALAVRPAVMPARAAEGIQVATTSQQMTEDRAAARPAVTPPAPRFVRQITARLDRLAFARFGR